MRFGERERAQGKFYAIKGPTKIWDVNMLIIKLVKISKLVKTKTSKYFIGYLDQAL